MWFKNEKDRIMIPLTVTLDINITYFNGMAKEAKEFFK